jgi:hypothetical protein
MRKEVNNELNELENFKTFTEREEMHYYIFLNQKLCGMPQQDSHHGHHLKYILLVNVRSMIMQLHRIPRFSHTAGKDFYGQVHPVVRVYF